MKKNLFMIAIVVIACAALPSLQAEEAVEEIFSLHLIPGVSIPLFDDSAYFTVGGAGTLLGRLTIPGFPYLSLELGAGYSLIPVDVAEDKLYSMLLNIISGKLGVGFRVPIGPLVLGAHVYGGYFYSFLGGTSGAPDTGSNPLIDAGLEVKYRLSPHFSLGLDASYRQFFGLSTDILLGLGVSYHFPIVKGGMLGPQYKPYPPLEITDLVLNDIFPVFYTHYADHPFGRLTIRNNGKIPIEKVKVQVMVKEYMDNPTICREIPFITGGGTASVDLTALFNEKMIDITENTKVQINLLVTCSAAGEEYGNEKIARLIVYDRNAMTWDDDRHPAAFVSIKDPAVLKFSKNVTSSIKDKASKALNKNLLTALAFFETMRLYGISYAVDPTTPFKEFSKKKNAVDFLQFPRHTLEYKAGDCDDLSILYCALLESVGIRSAFITVPGHIYAAVSLDMTKAEAERRSISASDLIEVDGTAWLPVEITALSGDFLSAWQAGGKLWKEQAAKGRARLIVLQDAWKEYEPVGLRGEGPAVELPPSEKIQSAYLSVVMKLIDRDLYPQTKKLEEQIKADPKNQALINKLGVLYARYGVYDKAEAAFNRIPNKENYAPALVNLGNIAYLKNDPASARRFYELAYEKNPNDVSVLLNLAKLEYEQSAYDKSQMYYAALKKRNQALAEKYSYLALKGEGGAARAALADAMRDQVAWGE